MNAEDSWGEIAGRLMEVSAEVVRRYERGEGCAVRVDTVEAYTFVYERCVEKPSKAEMMFSCYKELLTNHLMRSAFLQDDCNFIREFNRIWECYSAYVRILARKVFAYLVPIPSIRTGSSFLLASAAVWRNMRGCCSRRSCWECPASANSSSAVSPRTWAKCGSLSSYPRTPSRSSQSICC